MSRKIENIFKRTEKNEKNQADDSLMYDVAERWLKSLEIRCKQSTIVKYRNQLDGHIYPIFGNMRISEITNEDVMAFSNALLKEKRLSPKSASDVISRIKSIRKFALFCGHEVNFLPEYVIIAQNQNEIRVFSLQEEKILLDYLKSHLDLTSLGIFLCLFTGIRLGELCALTWSDIRLDLRELRIRRTMQRLQIKGENTAQKTYISIDKPKSKSSVRTIPIPEVIIDELRYAYTEDAYILTGRKNYYIEPRTMQNRFSAILSKCKIEDANFHTTRHTFATRCVEAGFDIKSLSEILGHANVNITLNRYVHPTMQLKRENMEKLSRLFAVK